jgi:ADP-heptose:LPS heptosyltransferase
MKILVIQLRRIGDIILTTPIPAYLKKALPSSTVDFLCEPMGIDVLTGHPDINEVVVYDRNKQFSEIKRIRSRRYDVVIDFLNNPRTAWIAGLSGARYRVAYKKTLRSIFYNVRVESRQAEYASIHKLKLVQAWLVSMGQSAPSPDSVVPKLHLTAEEDKFAQDWLRSEKVSPDRFVVMAPIHRHPIRQWRVDGYRSVGQKLASKGFQVYLSYGPGEEWAIREVQRGAENILKLFLLSL